MQIDFMQQTCPHIANACGDEDVIYTRLQELLSRCNTSRDQNKQSDDASGLNMNSQYDQKLNRPQVLNIQNLTAKQKWPSFMFLSCNLNSGVE